jgi:HD-GYP domain-containing protein (c-di-GMP phosphodiesterase class II)
LGYVINLDVFYDTLFYDYYMSFISIRLSTIKPGLTVPFDVYIRLSEKHVHYLRQGDDFDQNRLDSLKSRGLKKFHIKEEDELNYQGFLSKQLENIHLDTQEVKVSLALDVTENSASMVMVNPTTEKSYNMAKFSSDIVKKVMSDNDQILREIVSHGRNTNSDLVTRIQGHLVNTASIAIKFSESLNSNINSTSLGIAAFYHDVSFSQFSAEDQKLFFQEIKTMPAKDLTTYKTHPEKSVIALQDKPFADKDVLELIMTHEEKISGQGFPRKLVKLTQAQEVLSLCAFYDREVSCLGKDPAEVYNSMMVEQVGNYNLELLKKFKNFLKTYL